MELIFSFILSLGFVTSPYVFAESVSVKEDSSHRTNREKEKNEDFVKTKIISTDSCPDSFLKWHTEREKLRKSTELFSIFEFGGLLELCSQKSEQKKFFENPQFASCMKRLQALAGVGLENLERTRETFSRLSTRANIPPDAYKLPSSFQKVDFWLGLQDKNEENIKKIISSIKKENPNSVTFKYVSHFKPRGYFFITYWPDAYGDKFVHFDEEMAIIMLTKVNKDLNGEKIDPPLFILGSVDAANVSGDPPKITKDVIKVSELESSVQVNRGACYSCHQTGVMPVFPIDKSSKGVVSYDEKIPSQKVLEWFNSTHVKAGNTGYSQLLADMPDLGTESKFRNFRFVKECSDIKSEESIRKILTSMSSCVKCHDGGSAPPLKFPFGPTALYEEIKSEAPHSKQAEILDNTVGIEDNPKLRAAQAVLDIVMAEGHMPPKSNLPGHKNFLSPKERLALKDCLLSEYFGKMYPPAQKKGLKHDGLLVDYLLETECPK